MKETKLQILARLLKDDVITEEEFETLYEQEKVIQYIPWYETYPQPNIYPYYSSNIRYNSD